MKKVVLASVLGVAAAGLGVSAASAATLDDVKARGVLSCGVNSGLAGFAAPNDKGEWAGEIVQYDQGGQAKHDAPCMFAGHGVGAEATTAGDIGRAEFAAYAAVAPAPTQAVSPGRGVSGPPLPARGPPAQLI